MKHVLVIDDDEAIVEALELLLSDNNYSIAAVTRNDESLQDALLKRVPDLIILDMLLSGVDGRQIARKLKASEATKHIPIVMISAHPDARQSVLKAGADAFLSKPFDISEILTLIEDFTHNSR